MKELTLELLKAIMDKHYPKLEVIEMDNSFIWFSLDPLVHGSTMEYEGMKYKVLYSWKWTEYGTEKIGYIPVYCAELEPVEYFGG